MKYDITACKVVNTLISGDADFAVYDVKAFLEIVGFPLKSIPIVIMHFK